MIREYGTGLFSKCITKEKRKETVYISIPKKRNERKWKLLNHGSYSLKNFVPRKRSGSCLGAVVVSTQARCGVNCEGIGL